MLDSPLVPKGTTYVMIHLQKLLHLNIFLYPTWMVVLVFFFIVKYNDLSHLSRFLFIAVFTVSIILESVRVYLGYYGNLSCRVPELAGFLMITTLMQIPLISFFLLNSNLKSTPTEITLHTILWLLIVAETILGFKAIKHASNIAKTIYLSKVT